MKKEYIKPTLLVIKTEPSQILAGSQGDDEDPDVNWGTEGGPEGGEGELDPATPAKGGLWDEYTW
jgi:hypothetical protein